MDGYLALVLHAHLPWVRHPEHERFLEESWFYEAVADCYLPLTGVLEGWMRDGVAARLTVSVSPTLLAMWEDGLLRERCTRYLRGRVELVEREVERTQWLPDFQALAVFFGGEFESRYRRWHELGGDLAGFFRRAREGGLLELATTSATHAVLPLLADDGRSLRAQVRLGMEEHARAFGARPRGFWLPECGWSGEVESPLRETGVDWSVLETHGVMHARPRPRRAVYGPVRTGGGLVLFGRDPTSARRVWSRAGGYPGDGRYRDFYRDVGWDLDWDYVRPYVPSGEARGFTGLKYWAVGREGGVQKLYEPGLARRAVEEQAEDLVRRLAGVARRVGDRTGVPAVLVAPYDAELFGHWWFEGPAFLDAVVRRVAAGGTGLRLATPGEVIAMGVGEPWGRAEPATSSWGEGGYFRAWLGSETEWMRVALREGCEQVCGMVRRLNAGLGGVWGERACRQAARELLLAQASDWAFLVQQGTAAAYAAQRVREHLGQVARLAEGLGRGGLGEAGLAALESRDGLFPGLDWRWWG